MANTYFVEKMHHFLLVMFYPLTKFPKVHWYATLNLHMPIKVTFHEPPVVMQPSLDIPKMDLKPELDSLLEQEKLFAETPEL